jgi:hypothetical protein
MAIIKKGTDSREEIQRQKSALTEREQEPIFAQPLTNAQIPVEKSLINRVEVVVLGLAFEETVHKFKKPDEPIITILLQKPSPPKETWTLLGEFVEQGSNFETALQIVKNCGDVEVSYLKELKTYQRLDHNTQTFILTNTFLAFVDFSQIPTSVNKESLWGCEFLKSDTLHFFSEGLNFNIELKKERCRISRLPLWELKPKTKAYPIEGAEAILEALLLLRQSLYHSDLIFNFMPELFTLSSLQRVFELIGGQRLLAPVFRKKIFPKVIATEFLIRDKKFRPSRLYRYNPDLNVQV